MSDTDGLPEFEPSMPGFGIGDDVHFLREVEAGRELLYRQAYAELCEIVTGQAPSDQLPDEADFIDIVWAFFQENRQVLHMKLCEEFNWCGKRKKFGTGMIPVPLFLQLIFLLSDSVGGGVATASWLATVGLLDRFCGC